MVLALKELPIYPENLTKGFENKEIRGLSICANNTCHFHLGFLKVVCSQRLILKVILRELVGIITIK